MSDKLSDIATIDVSDTSSDLSQWLEPHWLLAPFKRLKWGFLPVRRIVKDETEFEGGVNIEAKEEELPIEYRDEKDRKWWRFFDDYEYRQNKYKRSKHKWYKWFNPSDTPEERRVVIKVDILLTLYATMAYWIKFLDQTNINNAYVGGLREGIGMKGNDLVNTQVMFTIGNIVFQIPFMYVLNGFPLSYAMPLLDIGWSIFTLGSYRVENVTQLKIMRFFIGAFEAPAFIGFTYLMGSWYTVDEVARRQTVMYLGQFLGLLTSGLLSGAIVEGMDGKSGLDSWRWIFIVDGLISLAVGVIGFYMIPGTPDNCYSIFLSDKDIQIARRRMKRNTTSPTAPVDHKTLLRSLFKWSLWKRILSSWHIYVLTIWDAFMWNNNNGNSGTYVLWLDSLKNSDGSRRYSPGKKQQMSALTPALGLIWVLLTGCFADLLHSRWGAIVFSQVFNITGNTILAVWHVNERAKWFAFCMQYFGWAMAPVLYSWVNDICRRDPQQRAITLVAMNAIAQITTIFIPLLVWKTVEAPRFLKGFTFTAVSATSLALMSFVVLYFYKRDEKRQSADNGIIIYNSDVDGDIAAQFEQKNVSCKSSELALAIEKSPK
ncbi:hypothetical protein LJB42_000462 [Komagataella kurtzmanii]|nr:hypothetical protein LJB42_000462 [Komagataella kurtzmanii]